MPSSADRTGRSRRYSRSSPTTDLWSWTRCGAGRRRVSVAAPSRVAAHGVDLGDVVAGKRGIPDLAVRRGRDAVRARAFRRLPGVDLAGRRIDAAVDAVLAGEPEDAFAVERRRIEIGVVEIPSAAERASPLGRRNRHARSRSARLRSPRRRGRGRRSRHAARLLSRAKSA